jgi:hypothetical protein
MKMRRMVVKSGGKSALGSRRDRATSPYLGKSAQTAGRHHRIEDSARICFPKIGARIDEQVEGWVNFKAETNYNKGFRLTRQSFLESLVR